mmetsp:Transcript_1105/g.1731  ORF Transcript_1105/g.1731 Transcript_1105/m.1731 type:complete len:334 (-) Transcript_1105:44-1045(-)
MGAGAAHVQAAVLDADIVSWKEAELRAKREGQSAIETYYFLHRDTLLSMEQGQLLPVFQALQHQGWLRHERIDLQDAVRGRYRQRYACLSHRWESKEHPDPRGEQLALVQEYLQADPQVEWVWIDFCCMPQQNILHPYTGEYLAGMRAPDEQEYFSRALKNVNMLYANMQVCILFDRSYNNRFWCLLEAILALSNPTVKGLVPSQGNEHHHFLCCGSYTGKVGMRAVHAFQEQWWGMPYVEALEVLRSDDVSVTNQNDKEKQLTALFELQGRVQTLMQHQAQQQPQAHHFLHVASFALFSSLCLQQSWLSLTVHSAHRGRTIRYPHPGQRATQ